MTDPAEIPAPAEPPRWTVAQVEKFLLENPLVFAGIMALTLMVSPAAARPAWLKDCPPVGGRRNGAWRGKGSFGHGFGPNRVTHK